METPSSKRSESGAKATGETRAVTDEEVNEFYAILRRMHDAKRILREAARSPLNCAARKEKDGKDDPGGEWRPAFAWEDFRDSDEGINEVGRKRKRKRFAPSPAKDDAIPKCLDLNAKPEDRSPSGDLTDA